LNCAYLTRFLEDAQGNVLVHLKCYRNRIVGSKENVTEVNGERNRPNEY